MTKLAHPEPIRTQQSLAGLTPEQIASDTGLRWSWITDHLKIHDDNGKVIPLIPNRGQQHYMVGERIQESRGLPVRIMLLKARQFGGSTAVQADIFARLHLLEHRNAWTTAHESGATERLFDMTKRFVTYMPEEERLPTDKKNGYRLQFSEPHGGGLTIATAGSEDAARSGTYQYAHCSEVASWPNQAATMASIEDAVPYAPGTVIVRESTAKGMGDMFHDDWLAAVKRYRRGDYTGYIPVFVGWLAIEKYTLPVPEDYDWAFVLPEITEDGPELRRLGATPGQMYWRRLKIISKNSNVDLFHQEFPSCIAAGARVSTVHGIVPIEHAVRGGQILEWYSKGIAETKRLTTKLGYEVVGTGDHPVATPDGFIDLGKLCCGDKVALHPPGFAEASHIVKWNPIPAIEASVKITEDMGRFLGYFMGDGSFYKNVVEFACNGDEDVRGDIRSLMKRLSGRVARERLLGKKNGNAWSVRNSDVQWAVLLRQLGCLRQRMDGCWKRKVCVPDCIWRSPRAVVREFLRGLFEADGFNAYGYPRVMFFTKDRKFATDVQLLLLGFGITCRRTRVIKKAGDGHEYHGNELALRKNEAIRFNEQIGFVSKRKRSRHDAEYVAKQKARGGRALGHNALRLVLEDSVASVEAAGEQAVYDLTTATQVFSANGILVHNCPTEAFVTSGRPVVTASFIDHHRRTCENGRLARLELDPAHQNGVRIVFSTPDRPITEPCWRVWKSPAEQTDYAVGADVAEGGLSDPKQLTSGEDWDYALVIDRETLEDVAEYRGQVEPDVFGLELVKVGLAFNYAWLAPEINNPGLATLLTIKRARYSRIMLRPGPIDRETGNRKLVLGWRTQLNNRDLLLDQMLMLLRGDPVMGYEGAAIVRSAAFCDELTMWVKTVGGKREHSPGHNDDTIMGRAVTYQVHLHCPRGIDTSPWVTTTRRSEDDVVMRANAVDPGPDFDLLEDLAGEVEEAL